MSCERDKRAYEALVDLCRDLQDAGRGLDVELETWGENVARRGSVLCVIRAVR